jgi:hypothetical protein
MRSAFSSYGSSQARGQFCIPARPTEAGRTLVLILITIIKTISQVFILVFDPLGTPWYYDGLKAPPVSLAAPLPDIAAGLGLPVPFSGAVVLRFLFVLGYYCPSV